MNNKLCVWARRPEYVDEMHHLFKGSVDYLQEMYDIKCEDEVTLVDGQYAVYNTNNSHSCWKVPLVHERDGVVVTSSEPLISLDEKIESEEAYADFVFQTTKDDQCYKRIFPKYFAARISNGDMDIFCDMHSLASCYVTMNDKFVAAGTHIGMLAYFTDDILEINQYGIHMYAQLGWFFRDTTAYDSINHISPGTIIKCRPNHVRVGKWHNIADLVSPIGEEFDVSNITSEWDIVLYNIAKLSKNNPTVDLSGGRDSRCTAAAWLSTKQPCTLYTGATIEKEGEVASSLIDSYPGAHGLQEMGITHRIYKSTGVKSTPTPAATAAVHGERTAKDCSLGLDSDFTKSVASLKNLYESLSHLR